MNRTREPRLADVRRAFHVVEDAIGLSRSNTEPAAFLAQQVCELIRGAQGSCITVSKWFDDTRLQCRQAAHTTWANPDAEQVKQVWQQEWLIGGRNDAIIEQARLIRLGICTRRRIELIDERAWQRTPDFQLLADPARITDQMACWHLDRNSGDVTAFTFHRCKGDPTFSVRESRLLRLFNLELARAVRLGRLQIFKNDCPDNVLAVRRSLSPRLQVTLEFLLAGWDVKSVAKKMGITDHTCRGYVKVIYQRFDVRSRAELLALFIQD